MHIVTKTESYKPLYKINVKSVSDFENSCFIKVLTLYIVDFIYGINIRGKETNYV